MDDGLIPGILIFGMVQLAVVGGFVTKILRTVSENRLAEHQLRIRIAMMQRREPTAPAPNAP